MTGLTIYNQLDCPDEIKNQIISLLRDEWPQSFDDHTPDWPLNGSETHPASLVLVENSIVISHAAVPWKYIKHKGQTYKAFGLSCVITNPIFRGQGYGTRLLEYATEFIKSSSPDVGLFTCDPDLEKFYTGNGWEVIDGTYLVGGTKEKPFPSNVLGKTTIIQLFSEKAQKSRSSFEGVPIFLELGEGKLW